jgi:hypothetical protein
VARPRGDSFRQGPVPPRNRRDSRGGIPTAAEASLVWCHRKFVSRLHHLDDAVAALSINLEAGESAIRQRPLLADTGGSRSRPAIRYCPVPQEARSCGLRFLDEMQKERVDPPGLLFGDPMSCSGDQIDVQQCESACNIDQVGVRTEPWTGLGCISEVRAVFHGTARTE